MGKIKVLPDQLSNQIAAGEVIERPASVAKELVENSIDAGAKRIEIQFEGGGRRLLRVADDGEGMARDDAILAFERHATSKISRLEDLFEIRTLGFRGEALASIAAVSRVELVTKCDDEPHGTRVLIEGGKLRDVEPAAHPRGTTITMRDLFFNVPARRKFLRSEATESFHLTNLITHYALAHPEIEFTLINNGRETLRAAPALDLRERAYQIFGADFIENLLLVEGGESGSAFVRGFVSAPKERRTSRDAQYLFVNGRFVRDKLIARALSEAYRSILPHGTYPAALLFLDVPFDEVDVNVHPAKIEVRFRRPELVAETIREAVRAALHGAGYVPLAVAPGEARIEPAPSRNAPFAQLKQERIAFDRSHQREFARPDRPLNADHKPTAPHGGDIVVGARTDRPLNADRNEAISFEAQARASATTSPAALERHSAPTDKTEKMDATLEIRAERTALPPLASVSPFVREVELGSFSSDIRPLGQLEDSYIIATDAEGLLLIDQHVAHERILFDKYRAREEARPIESQQLLVPEVFDLTPAQAAAFETIADELEAIGFALMRLSGRTVAIRAVPADLPPAEARNLLLEALEAVDVEKRGAARENLRDRLAAALACRAAIKINTPLTMEKMRWLIDQLLTTSSPTTCPHGRPIILRLALRDIEKGFHRT
jgi:DNA mismatch repair protein MutL